MLGILASRRRQVLGPLRTRRRLAADQQTPREQRLPLVAGEGRLCWMDQPACRGLPTERFFPRGWDGRKATEAKAICVTCQVQEPCRDQRCRAAEATAAAKLLDLSADFGLAV